MTERHERRVEAVAHHLRGDDVHYEVKLLWNYPGEPTRGELDPRAVAEHVLRIAEQASPTVPLTDHEQLQREHERLREAAEELARFAGHMPGCRAIPCRCGYAKAKGGWLHARATAQAPDGEPCQ